MKGPFTGGQPSRGSQRGTGRKKGQRAAGRTDRRQRRRDDVGVHVSGQAGGLAASPEPGQAGTQALPQPCPVVSGERKALAPNTTPASLPRLPSAVRASTGWTQLETGRTCAEGSARRAAGEAGKGWQGAGGGRTNTRTRGTANSGRVEA